MPDKKTPTETIETIETTGVNLKINSTITKKEKEDFLKCVMMEVSLSEPNLSFFELEESFISNFINMFTNQDTVSLDLDDVATYITVKDYLFSLSFVEDLYRCIEKQIIHKTASVEAIETFNIVMHKAVDLLDNAATVLDKNGSKLSKLLTKKNIEKFVDKLLSNPAVKENLSSIVNENNITNLKDITPLKNN